MNRVLIACSVSLFQIYFNNCLVKNYCMGVMMAARMVASGELISLL